MRLYKSHTLIGSILFIAVLTMASCDIYTDGGGEKVYKPPQTVILDVKRTPNPVAPGDTALITCILKDSLDERFEFYWIVNHGKALDGKLVDGEESIYRTDDKYQRWKASLSTGKYSFTVYVNNGSEDSSSVRSGFSIIVE